MVQACLGRLYRYGDRGLRIGIPVSHVVQDLLYIHIM